MTGKSKKGYSEKIYVRGKGSSSQGRQTQMRDDVSLLALQMVCTERFEAGEHVSFEDTHEIYNITGIVIETQNFSSLILVGSDFPKNNLKPIFEPLLKQLQNVIKSSGAKLYFIENFQMNDPTHLELNFLVKMSNYCFMQETSHGCAFYGYFRLEKMADDDRFASRSVETISPDEVAEQDIYLHFKKNNRFIKIVKKGESLEKHRRDRLELKGITDLFFTADQGVDVQRRRVHHIILQLLEEFALLDNAV
ncbi:MAG: hypothetical protein RJB66_246 [Pseudomonadota bacterium]|jgi:hypothetical protein